MPIERPTATSRQLDLAGLRLSYLEQGTASAERPSLVLLHGLMGCAATFAPTLTELPIDQHVVALDLPGAGGSERRSNASASLYATAQAVRLAITALGIEQPIVVGHSHGGAVAMMLAATDPKSVRSLVLLAPAHPYFREGDPLIRFYLTRPGRLFAYTLPWYPKWIQMQGLRRMAGPQSWDTVERLLPYRENLRTPGTMRHLLRLLRSWHADMRELSEWLRRPLETPCMLVWGDADRAVPVTSATRLRKRLLRSELHVLPGVGHRPAEETGAQTAAMLMDWITRDATVPATGRKASFSYKPNSEASHARMASLIKPSFDPGD